jgi:hypothetical protein
MVVDPNTLLNPASLSANAGFPFIRMLENSPTRALTDFFLPGTLRLCLLNPCASPLLAIPLRLSGVGLGGTTSFTIPGIPTPVVQSFGSWTVATVTLSSSVSPTVTAAGFAHGPLSNTVSLGLPGGVLQLVSPTQVTTSVPANMALVTRWTIEFLPEPGQGLLFGAGAAFMLVLGRRRMRR